MKPLRRRRPLRKVFIISFITVLAIAAIIVALTYYSRFKSSPQVRVTTSVKKQTKKPSTAQTIRLIASGDELAHDSVNQQAKTANGYDYTPFYSEVKFIFDKSDIRFCNQEVPSASPAVGSPIGYPSFNAPAQFATDLSKVGCNVINVATNHTNDKGQAGIDATLDHWDGLPKLAIAGANRSTQEQDKVRYFTLKGYKFAFLAYNYESNNKNLTGYGVNMFDEDLMRRQLAEAKSQGAYTLVSVHWGTEDSPGIDATQERWSTFLADNGADVVIGTGPHVIGPVKKLPKKDGGETLVWYSIGNMLSTQLKTEELIGGFVVMDFTVSNGKMTMKEPSFIPTYMHYEWTASEKAREDLLARKNLKIYPLDRSADAMSRSQIGTTVPMQTERVTKILNTYTPVKILNSSDY